MHPNAVLLAHAGAPSNRKDDQRYKAQLHAYLDLSSARISRLAFASPAELTKASNRLDQFESVDGDIQQNGASSGQSLYLDDTQLAYTALESQLFASTPAASRSASAILRRSRSRSARPTPTGKRVLADTAIVTVPSKDTICSTSEDAGPSQSSYLVSPFVDRRVKRVKLDDGCASQLISRSLVERHSFTEHSGHLKHDGASHEQTNRDDHGDSAEGTVTTDDTTSELPTSYSLSDAAPERLEHPPYFSDDNIGGPVHVAQESAESCDRIAKQQALPYSTSKGSEPIARDFGTQKTGVEDSTVHAKLQDDPTAATLAITALQTLSTDILPPEPHLGHGRFQSHVTSALQRLTQNLDVSRAFNPISTSREFEPLERGYWSIDCSIWPLHRQVDFWRYLEAFIQSGKVGWGVWCTRSTRDERTKPTAASDEDRNALNSGDGRFDIPRPHTLGDVRVYCWGEVVKHVYLLLYIASGSKVRKLGLQWIDAEGKIVVQMRRAT